MDAIADYFNGLFLLAVLFYGCYFAASLGKKAKDKKNSTAGFLFTCCKCKKEKLQHNEPVCMLHISGVDKETNNFRTQRAAVCQNCYDKLNKELDQ